MSPLSANQVVARNAAGTGFEGVDAPSVKKAPAATATIPAGGSAYVPGTYEAVSGVTTEIGDGATLEVG